MSPQPSPSGTSERCGGPRRWAPEEHGHDLWQGFFEEASDPVFTLDLTRGTITDANRAASAVLGYARDELAGMSIGEVVPELGDAPAWAELTEDLEDDGSKVVELTYRRRDGSTLPMEVRTRLLQLEDGAGFVLQVARDLTERKLAEERLQTALKEKETLLRELHHRVKNNLQVISGLFFLQSRATLDEEARRSFQEAENRIHALGLIHEKLYQRKNFDRIDFGTYVRELMDDLLVAYSLDARDIDLEVCAREVSLDVEKAIPCALILNELVSNALKHAFPDGREGKIRVVFDQEEDPGRYRLVVQDNGVGPPDDFDFQSGRSVGLQIARLLANQMRAEVLVETDEGLGITVTFE